MIPNFKSLETRVFFREHMIKIAIFLGTIILLSSLFYWYEYRPNQIRKACAEAAQKESRTPGTTIWNRSYDACLKFQGLMR